MSLNVTNIGRDNQQYPNWKIRAVNNTGADLKKGDLVLLDWTADGVANSAIAVTTVLAFNSYRKMIAAEAIKSGATGKYVIQGALNEFAIKASNGVITQGMALSLGATVGTGGAALDVMAAQAIGTVGVSATQAVAWAAWKGSAFDGGTIGGTLAGAGTVGYPGGTIYSGSNSAAGSMTLAGLLVFDGTDCNASLIKD